MALALEERAHRDDILIGDTPKAVKRRGRLKGLTAAGRLWKHSTLADIDGVVTPSELENLFCFCLVRNPWDRMVSYYHWLREQSFDHPAIEVARSHEFHGFLVHDLTRATIGAWPYARYMRDASGQERCNAFIRLEHLESDMQGLVSHLGFRPNVPHVNRSDRATEYRAYYTPEDRRIVETLCAEDIQRFGYTF